MGKIFDAFMKGVKDELAAYFKPAVIVGLEALRAESRKINYEMTGEQMYDVYWQASREHIKKMKEGK